MTAPDPSRIRRAITEINEDAASNPITNGSVSEGCAVVSLRSDGRGAAQLSGAAPVEIRMLMGGAPVPGRAELERLLGVPLGRIAGSTFATSEPRKPFASCRPMTVVPDGRYALEEILTSATAKDISDSGHILGTSDDQDKPERSSPWVAYPGADPVSCGFAGRAGGINEGGVVAAIETDPGGRERGPLAGHR